MRKRRSTRPTWCAILYNSAPAALALLAGCYRRHTGFHAGDDPPFSQEEFQKAIQGAQTYRHVDHVSGLVTARPDVGLWLLTPGQLVSAGEVMVTVGGLLRDNRRVPLFMPYSGKVIDALTVKNYPGVSQDHGIDPLAEIRALPRRKPVQAAPQPATAHDASSESRGNTGAGDYASDGFPWSWVGGILAVGVAGVALYFFWRLAVYLFHIIIQFVQDHATGFIIAGVILGCLLILGVWAFIREQFF